ncbi:MAG: sigma-54-dependent Fis family transcriptional regulator [Candidatus Kapabacteria bacterium]|jgi:two-component system, NtrC family, response regulator|nr:sigma-54-dependent Fis family transcriptional regulator [Candidatus Kapabacteria bacterium]
MQTVLIIDDEEKIRTLLTRIVSLEGFEVVHANTAKSALRLLESTHVDVILCDVKLPDAHGVELTQTIKSHYPHCEIILLTAYGTIHDGVQAMKNGAFDYITKGDDNNKIIPLLYKALEKVSLQHRVKVLEKTLHTDYSFESIIGSSSAIREAIRLAQKVAATDTTVLLTGETGTGKEVFAHAIHNGSSRRQGNFIAINCSAFTKEILESEMFGHKAGAFTGATKDKKGLFEEAHKGTLFLDEIGDMSLDLQAKLLRVLETGEYLRIGETKPRTADVRIIAATHKSIPDLMTKGLFREDLYYRISVFEIPLPPLRQRAEDIPALANHLAQRIAHTMNRPHVSFSHDYIPLLQYHEWKGNIRELKNVIERSIILTDDINVIPESLPYDIRYGKKISSSVSHEETTLAMVEKHHIMKIFHATQKNKTETAKLLGIGITTLYRKLQEYDITDS